MPTPLAVLDPLAEAIHCIKFILTKLVELVAKAVEVLIKAVTLSAIAELKPATEAMPCVNSILTLLAELEPVPEAIH